VNTPAPLERVETLLSTLTAERHVRRPLLEELAERLSVDPSRARAADAARALLARLDQPGQGADDFDTELRKLARLLGTKPSANVDPGAASGHSRHT
jgi:hypothetical protein